MKISNAALVLLFVITSAHAQLYKWVAPDGSVSYSDTPPPSTVAKVERKSYSNGPSLSDLPYEVAQAARNSPVTFYSMPKCSGCDQGRKLLTERGIPFSEKTVNTNEDVERVQKVSGGSQMPVLLVGRSKQVGFDSSQWTSALTAAGYPTSNTLPKSYTNPPPEAAAPPAKTADAAAPKKAAENQQNGIVQPPPPAGNAPPGFQF
jgi:glutaredoxin